MIADEHASIEFLGKAPAVTPPATPATPAEIDAADKYFGPVPPWATAPGVPGTTAVPGVTPVPVPGIPGATGAPAPAGAFLKTEGPGILPWVIVGGGVLVVGLILVLVLRR